MPKPDRFTLIPTLQIRPGYILLYNIIEPLPRHKHDPWQGGLYNFKKSLAYTGLLSKGSAKNLKRAIENILALAVEKESINHKLNRKYKWKINFITLTLPSGQGSYTDKEVKSQCLDQFLKSAKRRFGLGSYVWRAERQRNGNVHFHIVTDVYMDHANLRLLWNHQLERLNFIDVFEKKHGHRNPNSTDVHSVSKIKNLGAYMVKYMCKPAFLAKCFIAQPPWTKPERKVKSKKSDRPFSKLMTLEEAKINGRLWDCSTNLKQKHKCDFIIDTDTGELIEQAINVHDCKYKITPNCSLIFMDKNQFNSVVTGKLKEGWEAWKEKMR
jgi:hypothetical protein